MKKKANTNTRPNHFYETELWKLFERKAEECGNSVEELKEFCTKTETLSKQIIKSFPYFTLHDNTHIAGVCKWIYLLLGDKAELIEVEEAALLLMAACCHDLGMLMGENEEEELNAQAKKEYGDWKLYFERHPNDRKKLDSPEGCHDVVVNYVRENHHIRTGKIMDSNGLNGYFQNLHRSFGINKEQLFAVCISHGESLEDMTGLNTDRIDANLCAVFLRLADALDYDSNRAPEILYHFLGLDKAENRSSDEWKKNRSGFFKRSSLSTLTYSAECDDPQIEEELNGYLDWLKEELRICNKHIESYCHGRINANNNPIPHWLEREFERKGYDSAEIRLMMDQDGVLELLSGEELYGDPGVFVRELLQNSIDAILFRCEIDKEFSVGQGEINIDIWTDEKDGQYCWFRIKDNGIGMDKEIVQKYFLNVGRSYYNDEEGYIKDLLKQGKTAQNFTAISRFGIGILSCFMGEGKTNRIEVSTKRFPFDDSENCRPVRLDITGRNGYYYLTELSYEKQGEPMPRPPKEDTVYEYLRDIGTTICLRLDFYNTSISPFRELLDRYIRFPKIRISFTDHRTAENKRYPTQGELEALLDKLNPDFDETGEVTKYVHKLNEEDFEKLKEAIPEADWSNVNCPELVLVYLPLHKNGLLGKLSGSIIANVVKYSWIRCNPVFTDELGNNLFRYMRMRITFRDILYFHNYYGLEVDFDRAYYATNKMYEFADAIEKRVRGISIRFSTELTEDEAQLHSLISDHCISTAYNGIICAYNHVYTNFDEPERGVLLLNGTCRPKVSLARDDIRDIPFETASDVALLCGEGIHQPENLGSYPASTFYEFIEKHRLLSLESKSRAAHNLQKWISEFEKKFEVSDSVDNVFSRTDILNGIMVAALKKRGYIFVAKKRGLHIEKGEENSSFDPDGAFPIAFFADRFEAEGLGGLSSMNSFSSSHPLSKWLIENREILQNDARPFYDRIICEMVLSISPKELTLTLNMILDQLRNLPNNPFRVPLSLRINEGELTAYDDFQANR